MADANLLQQAHNEVQSAYNAAFANPPDAKTAAAWADKAVNDLNMSGAPSTQATSDLDNALTGWAVAGVQPDNLSGKFQASFSEIQAAGGGSNPTPIPPSAGKVLGNVAETVQIINWTIMGLLVVGGIWLYKKMSK